MKPQSLNSQCLDSPTLQKRFFSEKKAMILLMVFSLCYVASPGLAQSPAESSPTPTMETASVLDQRRSIAEEFIDLVMAQQYEAAVQYLHPQLREEWTPEVLGQRAEGFLRRTGDYVKRLDSQVDGEIVLVNTEFEQVTDNVFVIFGGNDLLITGIDFPEDPNPTTQIQ